MDLHRIVASLTAGLPGLLAADPRAALDPCRRILAADPAATLALYAAGQAVGGESGLRFAARLRLLPTGRAQLAAATLLGAAGDRPGATACLRRALLLDPRQPQAWRMLEQLQGDARALCRCCLLSPPSPAEAVRLLAAFARVVRDEVADGLPRSAVLRHLAAQAARCLRPPGCDLRARAVVVRAALASLGSRLVFEPELQAAIAGVPEGGAPEGGAPEDGMPEGGAAARFFDLARIAVLLEPGAAPLLQGLGGLAWGPSEVGERREALAVQAIAWFILAGGRFADGQGDDGRSDGSDGGRAPAYDLLRTLLVRDQRQNHAADRTPRYYALLNGAIDRSALPAAEELPPAEGLPAAEGPPAGPRPERGVGLYVGALGSITARCFVPGLVAGLARHGIPCTLYTTSAPGEAAGAVLAAVAAAHGVPLRRLDRARVADGVAAVAADRNALFVDLRGHTSDAFPQLLAARPAERTAHMIGSGETCGIPGVDFLAADRIARPDGPADRSEARLLTLGGGLLHFTPGGMPAATLPRRGGPGLRFGAFHQYSKINARCVALWAAALRETPGSSLTLKFNTAPEHGAVRILLRLFAAEGIAPGRIGFAPRAASLDAHFAMMATVDVLLDATPFNGETTTLEALWLGVPVVSVPGKRMIARFGASILHHAGLGRLCAPDMAGFGRTAAAVAADTAWLRAFRRDARSRLLATPTFDAGRYGDAAAAAFAEALAA